jgi:hypothetical protein
MMRTLAKPGFFMRGVRRLRLAALHCVHVLRRNAPELRGVGTWINALPFTLESQSYTAQ